MKHPKKPIIRTLYAAASLLAAGFACDTALADYSSTITNQKPEGYWRFSETSPVIFISTDAANTGGLSSQRQGTYNGDLAGRGATGVIAGDTAAHFDGVSEYISVTWHAAVNTPSNWSAETWFSPDTLAPAGGLTCVLSSGHFASPRSGWLIYQSGASFSIRFYNKNGTATSLAMTAPVPSLTVGVFTHLALTFDGTTARFYTNGVLCKSGAPTGTPNFVPGEDGPFSIGARGDAGFPNAGTQDEVAYYGTLLSPTQISAHFAAKSTNNAGYASQILADSPLLYFRLDETPLSTTANIGSYATDFAYGDGNLIYPVVSDNPGPSSPAFPGFGSSNVGISVSGGPSSMSAGGYVKVPSLQFATNTVTVTGWVKPNGSQASLAGIVMFRGGTTAPDTGTSAGLTFDKAGGLGLTYNWDGDDETINWVSGQSLNDGVWNFVSLIVNSNQAIVWAPGSNANPSTNTHTHASLAFEGSTYFGSDPAKSGLNGGLDEVAIFGRSLSVGEVYTEYATAVGGLAPRIFGQPQAPASTNYAGDSLTLSVDAGGTAPITYQWRKNTVTIAGANSASYTITNLVAGGPDTYDVVVTGTSALTSSGASITVSPAVAPIIVTDLLTTNRTIYSGGDIHLSVTAVGGGLGYYWYHSGTNLPGQNSSALNILNISSTNAGAYYVVVSNSVNSVSSLTETILVPTLAPGSYESTIVADAPVSWWRMDDSSTNMFDSEGRYDGFWNGTVNLGTATGALTNNASKAANFDGGGWGEVSTVPPPAASGDFTYELWVRPTDALGAESVPFSTFRPAYGFYFFKQNDGTWRGRDGYGDLDGTVSRQALIGNVTPSQWVHLVAVYNSSSTGTTGHKTYINGRWDGNAYLDFARNSNTPMRIGAIDPFQQSGLRNFFRGDIDEVAVYNKALTDAQILSHYLVGLYSTTTPPVFAQQPQSQTAFIGSSATFSPLIEGSPTISQNWYRYDGINTVLVGTNSTLTLTNLSYADAIGKTYKVVASNSSGSVTSSVVTLTVVPNPAYVTLTNKLVLHLAFEGNFNDTSGKNHNAIAMGSPSIVPGVVGTGALRYSTVVDGPLGHGGNTIEANYLQLPSSAYLPLAATADLSFSNNVSFSIAYWVKTPTNTGSGDLPFFCSAINSYQNYGLTFAPTYSSSRAGGWSWSLGDGSAYAGLYGAAGSIYDGKWHYLVHTFDRVSGNGITYLDGVNVSTVGISVLGDIDSGNPFSIGQDPTGTYNEAATNYLDDLAVWKGRVLTSTEAYSAYYVGKNFGKSFDVIQPITIGVTVVGSDQYVVWQGGTLYWADQITGPWTVVPSASAPYYHITPTALQKFFKVQ